MYNDIIFKLGEFATEAMIYEVSCFPSFGLVSPVSSGSHTDMDYFTFIDSTTALNRYFLEMASAGYSNDPINEIFSNARKIGEKAEKAMYIKTKGVNTHKGMIFVLGLGITASSKILYDGGDFNEISKLIKDMTTGIVESELKNLNTKTDLTHGEKIFLEYGISGVRGEAEMGFPIVFDYALGLYDSTKELGQNNRLVQALLGIMSRCKDTTILHRHDYETLLNLQKNSENLISLGGFNNLDNLSEINNLNYHNEKHGISPGGCADLLALTVFLSKLKESFFPLK
ncbi:MULTISPECIES: triphosphoribosyl-dephospho-CoA synthase CitG [Psychrilyobacter]|uniref:triphosphoribosyl-dephospho-CoA synthase n=1 Tax=Psychrilyobacter piezotolerans TaxID=2293438 RepID=A0ABX9KKQ2_9FUSO|nr:MULTISPECIES: triphosphoribosyl-dephospho-CoA synthase CitG [Psychrilyobacter]MCS5422041.1 triphosphoribosyl-dephospho-CoA synthase CitG [Psychrilyobacter sp. S5]NDI76359.1 triphosphoribosyl-dephospho-CoA synthase CitG [Psychrilyobacter piezotolerans]RDE65957.1 triphosphoribosyl-dephospho-CoA synthase CitG [Psychrilyobacter sp. S5]REI43135.1 triphosphoribosyl-dephospho-CoA synthase CitG [Psychrilyobacter piezotolerans]